MEAEDRLKLKELQSHLAHDLDTGGGVRDDYQGGGGKWLEEPEDLIGRKLVDGDSVLSTFWARDDDNEAKGVFAAFI
jgi:hypothetical protein